MVPLVLLADPRRWRGLAPIRTVATLAGIVAALLLLTVVVPDVAVASIGGRLLSGPTLLAELLLLGVSLSLLRGEDATGRPPPAVADRADDVPPADVAQVDSACAALASIA
jgi:hypothetical protein